MDIAFTEEDVVMKDYRPTRVRNREPTVQRCAHCGEPLPFNTIGILAWRLGDQWTCNEFCASGIAEETTKEATSA
jgi:hypothetical protein